MQCHYQTRMQLQTVRLQRKVDSKQHCWHQFREDTHDLCANTHKHPHTFLLTNTNTHTLMKKSINTRKVTRTNCTITNKTHVKAHALTLYKHTQTHQHLSSFMSLLIHHLSLGMSCVSFPIKL